MSVSSPASLRRPDPSTWSSVGILPSMLVYFGTIPSHGLFAFPQLVTSVKLLKSFKERKPLHLKLYILEQALKRTHLVLKPATSTVPQFPCLWDDARPALQKPSEMNSNKSTLTHCLLSSCLPLIKDPCYMLPQILMKYLEIYFQKQLLSCGLSPTQESWTPFCS